MTCEDIFLEHDSVVVKTFLVENSDLRECIHGRGYSDL